MTRIHDGECFLFLGKQNPVSRKSGWLLKTLFIVMHKTSRVSDQLALNCGGFRSLSHN